MSHLARLWATLPVNVQGAVEYGVSIISAGVLIIAFLAIGGFFR
jgi:hypothetical protein